MEISIRTEQYRLLSMHGLKSENDILVENIHFRRRMLNKSINGRTTVFFPMFEAEITLTYDSTVLCINGDFDSCLYISLFAGIMNISGTITLVIVLLNSVFVFGQFDDAADDDDSIRRNILKYILYNSRRTHERSGPVKTDNPLLTQVLDYTSSQKVKKSHLYGLNRPITLRQTRLASFGTILRPHNANDAGATNILRYG